MKLVSVIFLKSDVKAVEWSPIKDELLATANNSNVSVKISRTCLTAHAGQILKEFLGRPFHKTSEVRGYELRWFLSSGLHVVRKWSNDNSNPTCEFQCQATYLVKSWKVIHFAWQGQMLSCISRLSSCFELRKRKYTYWPNETSQYYQLTYYNDIRL